ncbi:probable LRR receptor-like serine/threonine-protein kinase At1g74360 isoform X2 [Prosopis cineraria]|uniref:probable LRR receptor-like serine/threonine-protein kinase At1g74360 isoform X2 n=1 Tax=Prosopis cineraria TaxID=364024 RepID=UPI00241054F5|nr:probable LRR receptor-like serine/threonine-protein kinase At1g74360 isoform X2 [Prosopis cineraria]
MSQHVTDSWGLLLICFAIIFSGKIVAGDSLDTDREVLLQLKSYLNNQTLVDQGRYTNWNTSSSNPCEWSGISCSGNGTTRRVVGVDLSGNKITGQIFQNFSQLTQLTHLDLSRNTLSGKIPADLRRCHKLVYLNLSYNILPEELNLIGLTNLQTLDLSGNRLHGDLGSHFPAICDNLISLNISGNSFTGRVDECFDQCLKLQYLDLSTNKLSGGIWMGIAKLRMFSVSENVLSGTIPPSAFPVKCNLEVLDISENMFTGNVPQELANCKNLTILNLSSNKFNGSIPKQVGSISGIEALYLGNNNFSRDIPEELLNLTNLAFLDLTRNQFGGNIQEIFGKFKQVKYLLLHSNNYTGGLSSSGTLKLPNILRLDLSCNNFSGPLPTEISQMSSLKLLMLAYNQFTGPIPLEFGNLPRLQALDLSFNNLSGPIPPTLGKLTSLLWLMLANNSLTGEIPRELGNCSSLLWINLANNKLTGKFPPELANIGRNAMATFESNRQYETVSAGSGECLAMKRWIPADYPPFSFVYDILTRKNCRSIWDRLLKGYGIFPICNAGTFSPLSQISGYVQLSGNQLSGEVPPEIGTMQNLSMLHLGLNRFSGKLPAEVKSLRLVVLNITRNEFSGEIPWEIGTMKCLQNLDLSYNNFSGVFPSSLNNLSELSKFNISYNPLISGEIPSAGQLATFEKYSYLGNPLLHLPSFIDNTTNDQKNTTSHNRALKKSINLSVILVFFALTLAFLIFGLLTVIVCLLIKTPSEEPLLTVSKLDHESGTSSPWLSDIVKVIRLDRTAFTHADILKATGNFSDNRIIGKGGFGTVYRGIFSDGREVAVKKLQREGLEGEKEFRAEMEVLSGHRFGWPHPNLVTLYGWCLDGSEKILVYEYISGGSLEDLVTDRTKFTWKRRLEVAIDVAQALVYLHHECYPSIVHRDVKASNVLLDNKTGKAKVTDFGLARVVDVGGSHVSTMVAGTVGYVAPEYGHTWKATTKGDVYSYGVLAMELATGRRALDGGEECLVEWGRRVIGQGRNRPIGRPVIPVVLMGSGLLEGMEEMMKLLKIGVRCTVETPQARPTMKEVLDMLIKVYNPKSDSSYEHLSHW